ncbi:class I lanthipeptide [Chryseobacterium oncorhynchi]|uniref:class I lanthipeptide n=1 Tax=Chryseobacterium oncorhynchi TaxID=741074 RepID=UPI00140339A0|nr:class I lanthipeptide [Chryseobacterium oncorhynchi]
MSKNQVKLGKSVTLNKDAVTKLQEDQLNKVKGGIKSIDQDMQEGISLSCLRVSCNPC